MFIQNNKLKGELMAYDNLFKPISIGEIEFKNRYWRRLSTGSMLIGPDA